MAVSLSVIAAKDSAGSAIAGGLQAQDKSGAGTGPFTLGQILIDGVAGANMAQVTAANAVKVDGSAVTQPISLAAAAAAIAKAEDVASADADVGVGALAVRKATPANTSGTDGDYEFLQMSAGRLWTNSLLGDGTNAVAVKAASTAPVATDPALVVAISPNSVNANGRAADASSAPVTLSNEDAAILGIVTETAPASDTASSGLNGRLQRIAQRLTTLIGTTLTVAVAPSTTDVAVTPTVTASAYTANNCIGGIMTFPSILAATSFNGILQSITAKFKGAVVTGTINVHVFKASPSNGTYTDKTAVTWNAADMANLFGTYQLTAPLSTLGTMTTYNLDGIAKALVGASTSLFVVATVAGTPTPASTSDFTLELSVLPG